MRGSGQRLPITLRFTRVLGTFSHTTCFPFSCALWACFSDRSVSGERSEPIGAPMQHAALWVVQPFRKFSVKERCSRFNAARGLVGGATASCARSWRTERCFNAARGFVGGATTMRRRGITAGMVFQCRTRLCGWCNPQHLALSLGSSGFNAARGFVGGATFVLASYPYLSRSFQCRTRLCGWCSSQHHAELCRGGQFQCRTRLCGWCSNEV